MALDLVANLLGKPRRDGKTSRQAEGRGHATREGKGAEALDQFGQPASFAWDSHREPALRRDSNPALEMARERSGRGFSKIEGHDLAGLGQIDERETPAPQSRGEGIEHAQRQGGCADRVDGIAPGPEHFHARG